jgi:hypothetical protein
VNAPAPIPVARPWLDERDAEAACRAIMSGWVTQGPEVAAFEREFAVAVGARHACAVSSCTTALHLALLALGVGPGDEVVTVSHSFIATANAVRYCGATPVFVDVTPETFNIDPSLLEAAVSDRTKAIPSCTSSACPVSWRRSWPLPIGAACRLSKMRRARSAASCCGRAAGSALAGRTPSSRASRSTRANCSPPATVAC